MTDDFRTENMISVYLNNAIIHHNSMIIRLSLNNPGTYCTLLALHLKKKVQRNRERKRESLPKSSQLPTEREVTSFFCGRGHKRSVSMTTNQKKKCLFVHTKCGQHHPWSPIVQAMLSTCGVALFTLGRPAIVEAQIKSQVQIKIFQQMAETANHYFFPSIPLGESVFFQVQTFH